MLFSNLPRTSQTKTGAVGRIIKQSVQLLDFNPSLVIRTRIAGSLKKLFERRTTGSLRSCSTRVGKKKRRHTPGVQHLSTPRTGIPVRHLSTATRRPRTTQKLQVSTKYSLFLHLLCVIGTCSDL